MNRWLVKILIAFFWTVFYTVLIYSRRRAAAKNSDLSVKYAPAVSPMDIPIYLSILTASAFLVGKGTGVAFSLFGVIFDLILVIGIYYMLLTLMTPFLREHMSAENCALMWVLPGITTPAIHLMTTAARPLLTLRLNVSVIRPVLAAWAAGALVSFVIKLVSHFSFRQRIISSSVPVSETETVNSWNELFEGTGKAPVKLIRSSYVATPLTIGVTMRYMLAVLPEKDYSDEELKDILTHEFLHIMRKDSLSKLLIALVTALLWFVPFIYPALRRLSEDMELCCDEQVLNETDETTADGRRRYAALILSQASDERGFTSCLSSSAGSLRYRLKRITGEKKKTGGAPAVALTLFILMVLLGNTALAKSPSSLSEKTGINSMPEEVFVNIPDANGRIELYDVKAPDEFTKELLGITVWDISGTYRYTGDTPFYVIMRTDTGTTGISLEDEYVIVTDFSDPHGARYYMTEEPLSIDALKDWLVKR